MTPEPIERAGSCSGESTRSGPVLRILPDPLIPRVAPGELAPPDPARTAAGWERRFVADEVRAAEMIALYRELGYETAADPVRPEELADECSGCRLVAARRYTTIYTRRPRPGTGNAAVEETP